MESCNFDCDHCRYSDCIATGIECARHNTRDHMTWADAFKDPRTGKDRPEARVSLPRETLEAIIG